MAPIFAIIRYALLETFFCIPILPKTTDYILGRTTCREGIAGLNANLTADYPVGSLITDVLSLSKSGRASVIEYVGLQKIKEKRAKK